MPAKKKPSRWVFPVWMRGYLSTLSGDEAWITELMNDHTTTVFENAPRAVMCVAVKSQIGVLTQLHDTGKLATCTPDQTRKARKAAEDLAGQLANMEG